ncbi:MAG: flagellar biosynthesis protein FliQ [Lachnospiraceae bacterium]|nr:flagellar biosynthesis protein FliQ [Lachnospiraceae bacterium]MDE7359866.1 flagellar biosynthesis protein FliQ [Lachnospiraceae bacterium]
MTVNDVTTIAEQAIYTIIKCSAPMLLVSLCVGLIVSIFQTVTSIQEQTLTFVPKVLAIFLALIIMGHWIMNNMVEFMTQLWNDFNLYVR